MIALDSQEIMDFSFCSSSRGKWCLVKHDVDTPWIHIAFTSEEGSATRTLLTSDMTLVKQILNQSANGERIKSFQVVFPSDFPDNKGWGIAEVNEFTEQKTRKGMVFHTFITKFGHGRIGAIQTMASEVLPKDVVVLYTATKPERRERRYFE